MTGRQKEELIATAHQQRADLVDQIRRSKETIARSQELIERLDVILAQADSPSLKR